MQLAVEDAATFEHLAPHHFEQIHAVLLQSAPRSAGAGAIRDEQNWIGGNDYNPCGADFVPPPPGELDRLLADLCTFCSEEALPPLVQAAIAHAQFETIHPFNDGNGRTGRALVQYCCGGVAWRRTTSPRSALHWLPKERGTSTA